jgi:peroxiredoxin
LTLFWPSLGSFAALLSFTIACGFIGGCSNYLTQAPNAQFKTLMGQTYTTAQFRGKVWLVNFWATTCTVCIKEMPQIVSTYNQYKDRGFETVAVAMRYDSPALVVNFAQTRQLPFHVALDLNGDLAKQFGNVQATPSAFLINKRGKIIKRFVGVPDFTELNVAIANALAEPV